MIRRQVDESTENLSRPAGGRLRAGGQAHVFAQDWPSKPVRILVGSAPGGGTDAMARAVADRLGPLLKQPVVVENRPGVSNTLALTSPPNPQTATPW